MSLLEAIEREDLSAVADIVSANKEVEPPKAHMSPDMIQCMADNGMVFKKALMGWACWNQHLDMMSALHAVGTPWCTGTLTAVAKRMRYDVLRCAFDLGAPLTACYERRCIAFGGERFKSLFAEIREKEKERRGRAPRVKLKVMPILELEAGESQSSYNVRYAQHRAQWRP